MYATEWMMWWGCLKSDEELGSHSRGARPSPRAVSYVEDVAQERAAQQAKRCDRAVSRGPVYAANDIYMEMRCGGMEDKRGLITLATAIFVGMILYAWAVSSGPILFAVLLGSMKWYDSSIGWQQYFDLAFDVIIFGVPLWLYFRHAFRFSRLEVLTSRHLLVRFNRITRQVYLHRPSHCGGVLVLPWNGTTSMEMAGQRLMLGWFPDDTPLPFPNFALVGKPSSRLYDLQAEWEFIRRYMDEGGLQAVERPRISSQVPLPWPAFTAQFEALGPFLRNSGPLTWLGCVLISPAFVIVGLSHWASLLLCWRPRWPRVIREAGQPGKLAPAFTTVADYPPDVQSQLLANAHRWKLRPGRAPESSSRVGKKRERN
ncbi:hypothetical protein FBY20_4945 [Achromobacter sp. SLBN-14]|nr:hypothetical protein FBY20_4945 [Achromobacter sp. SLBN-14]